MMSTFDSYIDTRKDYEYYKYARTILKMICREEDTICDVGSWRTDMISFLPCKRKMTIDLREPFCNDYVEGIRRDYLTWNAEKLDVITCFQVLEHIDDDHVEVFAHKLLRDAPIAVVSVPYLWPEGKCKEHLQDPIDAEKLVGWFGKMPVFLRKITEKNTSTCRSRLFAIFINGVKSEIDMDYWKTDAEEHVAYNLKKKTAIVKKSKIFNTGHYTTWLKKITHYGIKDIEIQTKNTLSIKISVIIPVWNVENYIKRCLDSLVNQTFKDLEFIFIDDCGTDNSIKIVEQYAIKDSRIKIIKNDTNIGPGPSRNKGIEIAKGEFLSFIDADDWVSLDWYDALYHEAQKNDVDIVKGDMKWVDESGNDITPKTYKYTNDRVKARIVNGEPLYRALKTTHWSMLYSKYLFEDKNIRYGNMLYGEDSLFLMRVFLMEPKIVFCDIVFYYRLIRSDSLTANVNFEKYTESLKSLEERIRHMKKIGFKDEYYVYLTNYVKYLIKNFSHYWKGKEDEAKEDMRTYVSLLEETVQLVDNPSRILGDLSEYIEIKKLTTNE